jgi:hypothetical protein
LIATAFHLLLGQEPYANTKPQYYFLFIFWDIFEFFFIYFFYVETRRRTLEEISEIFRSPHPVKTSLSKTAITMHGTQGVTEILDEKDTA